MSDYAQLDSPNKISRIHPAHSTHDDDEKSFRSISSKFSRTSRKSVHNGELSASLMSSQGNDEETLSCDKDDSFSTTDSSLLKSGAASPPSSTAIGSSPVNSPSYYETATMAQDDPFYMFRGDLIKKLLLVEGQLERYLDIVQNTVRAVLGLVNVH